MGESRAVDRLLLLTTNVLLIGLVVVLALLLVEVKRMFSTDDGIVLSSGNTIRLSNSYINVDLMDGQGGNLGSRFSPIHVTSSS